MFVGKRFGRLVILEYVGKKHGNYIVRCLCDCGKEHIVRLDCLRNGDTKSCGCLPRSSYKHGNTKNGGTREYHAWKSAKRRCYNPKSISYRHYGGRGIQMCPEWRENFQPFLRDMGNCPQGHTLDRINNDGNYEPTNCRWATRKEQAQNRRQALIPNCIEFRKKYGYWPGRGRSKPFSVPNVLLQI